MSINDGYHNDYSDCGQNADHPDYRYDQYLPTPGEHARECWEWLQAVCPENNTQKKQAGNLDIITTNGENFSHDNSADLAWMVYVRFGRNLASAHAAWCRLLQNNCYMSDYEKLIKRSSLNNE